MDLLHWWLTPKFPEAHIEKILSYKPLGFYPKIRNLYRTWIIHPIKRRVTKYYAWLLQRFFGLKVIGITGSTGKTTTKEMLASILRLEGKTIYSFANIDPVYNIPTTILRCTPATKYLILEMGVEYENEMDFYLWLAKPDVSVITNIYPTHTLNFKDEEGVLKEKSKLAKNLAPNSCAVLNSENEFLKSLKGKIKAKIIWFGKNSQIQGDNIKYSENFKTDFKLKINEKIEEIQLPILGKHFVNDALGAATAAYALGISIDQIKRGLEKFEIQDHRMNVKKLKSGAILIDDSYNNNPAAAKEAINVLKEVAGKRKTILIFGDMLELGKKESFYHKEIGKFAKKEKIDYVIGVGQLSKYVVSNKRYYAKDFDQVIKIVKPLIANQCIILVKGSRAIGLEKIVSELTK